MVAKRRSDTRLNSDQSGVRADRHMQDRNVTQDRTLSDDERVAEFRQQYFPICIARHSKDRGLPRLLVDHGGIHATRFMRAFGWANEPIKVHDIAGWDHASIKTGEWEGCIGVNEMIAFKLPLEL